MRNVILDLAVTLDGFIEGPQFLFTQQCWEPVNPCLRM